MRSSTALRVAQKSLPVETVGYSLPFASAQGDKVGESILFLFLIGLKGSLELLIELLALFLEILVLFVIELGCQLTELLALGLALVDPKRQDGAYRAHKTIRLLVFLFANAAGLIRGGARPSFFFDKSLLDAHQLRFQSVVLFFL